MSNISKLKRAQNEEKYLLQHIEEYKECLKSAQDRVLKLRNMEILGMVKRSDLNADTLKKIISDYQAERLLEERRMEEEMKLASDLSTEKEYEAENENEEEAYEE